MSRWDDPDWGYDERDEEAEEREWQEFDLANLEAWLLGELPDLDEWDLEARCGKDC